MAWGMLGWLCSGQRWGSAGRDGLLLIGLKGGFGIGLVRDWVVSSVVVGPDRTVLGLDLGRGRAWVWAGSDRAG